MGRKWLGFLAALGIAAALLGVLLPLREGIGRKLCLERRVLKLEQRMAQLTDGEVEQQLKLARWYNLQLEQKSRSLRGPYEGILNLGQGQMGLLEVPELGLRLPITHGIEGEAGHDAFSALPLGGEGEQSVIHLAEHRYWLPGMAVYTHLPGRKLCWQVISVQVMPRGWPADAPPGQRMLTLVYDRGVTRTLIRCIPGENMAAEKGEMDRWSWESRGNIGENRRKSRLLMILRL